ncbi:unnamed protein product [Amoebophrya sp. A120]|nr:unnamed protein product [Amoebophrya sp. A120]|eukprot:GSA120T00002005001.1
MLAAVQDVVVAQAVKRRRSSPLGNNLAVEPGAEISTRFVTRPPLPGCPSASDCFCAEELERERRSMPWRREWRRAGTQAFLAKASTCMLDVEQWLPGDHLLSHSDTVQLSATREIIRILKQMLLSNPSEYDAFDWRVDRTT